MPIDVKYEGLALARDTKLQATPQGSFVEMPAPMPVGTRLLIEGARGQQAVRVARVHEGVGPGVFVVALDGGALKFEADAPGAAAAPAAQKAAAAVPAPAAEAAAAAEAELTVPTRSPAEAAPVSAMPDETTARLSAASGDSDGDGIENDDEEDASAPAATSDGKPGSDGKPAGEDRRGKRRGKRR